MVERAGSLMANPRGPTRALALFALTALTACSSPPLPPPAEPTPPAPKAEQAAPVAAPPRLSLLEATAEPAPEALSAGPVVAFAGRFEPVLLPAQTRTIVHVDARNEKDVWMLAADGRVFRWDGARVVDRGAPHCFTDSCCGSLVDCTKQPALCKKAAVEACQPFASDCAIEVAWSSIQVTPDDVSVRAIVETGGMRASVVDARLGKNGRWACEQGPGDLVYPGSIGRGDGAHADELTVDGASLRFEGPAYLVNRYGGYMLLIDGRRVPLPDALHSGGWSSPAISLAARSPSDLWLWSPDGSVWRGNGLGWTWMPTGLDALNDVWFAAPASVWVLGAVEEGKETLLRWDLESGGGQRFETPGATNKRGDGRDFWLFGRKALYRWDGAAMGRATPPLEIEHVWRGSSGELWLVGSDLTAPVKTADDEEVRMGAVFRVPGGQKP